MTAVAYTVGKDGTLLFVWEHVVYGVKSSPEGITALAAVLDQIEQLNQTLDATRVALK